ncbi:hypothetical protein NU219Hw_g2599t1 [Hortaea werneckii]
MNTTQTPLFAGLEVSYPFTGTTPGPVAGEAGGEGDARGRGLTTLFGPSIVVRDPTTTDLTKDHTTVSSSPSSSPPAASPKSPTHRSSAPAKQKGSLRAPSALRLHKRNAAGFKVALGRLRVRIALRGEADGGVGEGLGGAVGEEVDFNRFERKVSSVLRGVVGLEKEMVEGFEGDGGEIGDVGGGYEGQGGGEVEGEGDGEDEDEVQGQDEDQGQVEDEAEADAEAEVERYGDEVEDEVEDEEGNEDGNEAGNEAGNGGGNEDEEIVSEGASLEDLLVSTDLLSLSDSKATYAQWEDRTPSRPTPGTDDIKEQEEIDIAFVEAIHATNAMKWGSSASIRDISPSSNDASTTKTSQKRPTARATQQTPFKLHIPRDYGKNPYYTADWTLEGAAKQIRLTLAEANASCKQWISLHSREEFESLIQRDREIGERLNAMCQDLGYIAQLVEYGREGWNSAELSKMVLTEVCEVGGELVDRLRVLAGYQGCQMLEKIAVAPLVRVWKGLSE